MGLRWLFWVWVMIGCVGEKLESPEDPVVDSTTDFNTEDTADEPDTGPSTSDDWLLQRTCDVVVEHTPPGGITTVQIAGSFSDWEPVMMDGPDEEGSYHGSLGAIEPGHYPYKFLYNGEWEDLVPDNTPTHWDGDFENRDLMVGDCQRPLLQVMSAETGSDGTLSATLQFARADSGSFLDPSSLTVTVGSEMVTATANTETGVIEIQKKSLPFGKHALRVWVSDENGVEAENGPLYLPLWVEETPFQWEDSLMYLAFTDRFRNGDYDDENPPCDPIAGVPEIANYLGGDFLGIQHAMDEDYFTQLGANLLWLAPVYENPHTAYLAQDGAHLFSGFHGYWPEENRSIETCFGDDEADSDTRLRELISTAHGKGIRVLFDLVLNHTHEDHPWVETHGEWFNWTCTCGESGCDWNDFPLTCQFMPYLPDLNYRNHEAVQAMVEDVVWWVKEYDVDAFRIDAAKHMDSVILKALRHRLEQEFSHGDALDVYLVGETFSGTTEHDLIMSYVGDGQLHGQYDFPLMWSIRDAFAHGGSLVGLEQQVLTGQEAYEGGLMSPFAGNHDVPRLASEIAGNVGDDWGSTEDWMAEGDTSITQEDLILRLSLTHAFTMTQPGIPLLYYGDEIGLAGGGDPDNRRMMNFAPYLSGNQQALLDRTQVIGQAYRQSEALRRGAISTWWIDESLYVYLRDAGQGEIAVVVIHKGTETRTQVVPVPLSDLEGLVLSDATQDRSVQISEGEITLQLDALDYGIFLLSPE